MFRVATHRFEFRAAGSVYFPAGKAGNVLRGALGAVLNDVLNAVQPGPAVRPSGLAEPPRPFVLRAAHLDGRRFQPGETFALDVNVFDLRPRLFEIIRDAFANLSRAGLGPGRGLVHLMQPVSGSVIELDLLESDLARASKPVSRIRVLFRTPTALKGCPSRIEAPFDILIARIRDRIATLSSIYGEGPLPLDFRGLAERAKRIRTTACDLEYRDVSRRSSRSGETHGIGGFTGTAEYEGDLGEFLPYLRAAAWTGVGRHTVWGNGAIEVVVLG